MFTKNKASARAGTNMPTLLGSEGDSLPRFPGVGTGAHVSWRGHARPHQWGLDSGTDL